MQKIEIVKITSLNRAPLLVEGYLFKGSNPDAPSVAVVGAMEGQNIIPLHSASKLVDFLKHKIQDEKRIKGDILVIPSVNHYALNINERFWPLDKTDINMMFPGYDQGETTQRIAKKLFDALQGYTHTIILENRKDLASCMPYVKLFKSGYEDLESAKNFGNKIIHHADLNPIDTVTLQYNLQLWGQKAYSIICPNENQIETQNSYEVFERLVQFLSKTDVIDYKMLGGYESTVITQDDIEVMKTPKSGIFIPRKKRGDYIVKGEMIGKVVHALEGNVIHKILAPSNGIIVCYHNNALIFEDAVTFRIARSG